MRHATVRRRTSCNVLFFFFNDTATTEIYTLSLHDALPISTSSGNLGKWKPRRPSTSSSTGWSPVRSPLDEISERSEEHTSELQSLAYLVCRLLLEKKKARGFLSGEWRPRPRALFVRRSLPV